MVRSSNATPGEPVNGAESRNISIGDGSGSSSQLCGSCEWGASMVAT